MTMNEKKTVCLFKNKRTQAGQSRSCLPSLFFALLLSLLFPVPTQPQLLSLHTHTHTLTKDTHTLR